MIQSGIQPFQNTGTVNFLSEAVPELDKRRWFERFIGRGLATLEARTLTLSGRYLVGDDVSIADVLLVPQLYAARHLNLPLDALPRLLAIEARCLDLPGFAAAHPDRQGDRE